MPARPPIAVPFLDVGAGYRELKEEYDEAYQRVMNSGWFVLGQEVEPFEEQFAARSMKGGVKSSILFPLGTSLLNPLERHKLYNRIRYHRF